MTNFQHFYDFFGDIKGHTVDLWPAERVSFVLTDYRQKNVRLGQN
jgi:hypothetical protein